MLWYPDTWYPDCYEIRIFICWLCFDIRTPKTGVPHYSYTSMGCLYISLSFLPQTRRQVILKYRRTDERKGQRKQKDRRTNRIIFVCCLPRESTQFFFLTTSILFLTHSPTLSGSLSQTHTHTHTKTLMHTHSLSLSPSTPTHIHTNTYKLSISLTRTLSPSTPTHIHTITYKLSLSLTHTHTLPPHPHTYTQTHKRSLFLSLTYSLSISLKKRYPPPYKQTHTHAHTTWKFTAFFPH